MITTTKPFLSLTAADLMCRDVVTLPRSMSLRAAGHLLSESHVSGAPVVDETGIEGGWNFFIGWTPRGMLHQVDNSNQPVGTAADPTGISFFEAVERELGLKLVKQTRMYPVIVVDHIEERPVE